MIHVTMDDLASWFVTGLVLYAVFAVFYGVMWVLGSIGESIYESFKSRSRPHDTK